MSKEDDIISVGDHVIIQRQSFTKLHRLRPNGTVSLGRDQVELKNVIGKPYYSTFRMVLKPQNRRVYDLEEAEFVQSLQNVNTNESGTDNRDIIDDGRSQQLSIEEITKFRDDASLSSSDIVEKLATNSTTFKEKTEYSQEKYLKKKEKKYFEYIQIRKTSLRLIAEVYHRLNPGKIQGLRIDDVAQILAYANVQSNSNVLLYDHGSGGLLAASITNALGKNTQGTLINMHPGNYCQKEAFQAMNFPSEQAYRCINVCIYSVLRCFYQEFKSSNSDESFIITEPTNEPTEEQDVKIGEKRKHISDSDDCQIRKRNNWEMQNKRACTILENKVDSLIIAATEYPTNIVQELATFLNFGRPFVVFHSLREPLTQLYTDLKSEKNYIALKLSNNLLRTYQVLPDRTHPEVNMTSGGYILTGFKIDLKSE